MHQDGRGGQYFPQISRLGKGHNKEVASVSLDQQVEAFLRIEPTQVKGEGALALHLPS